MLNARRKWTVRSRDLAVGDMVICFDQYLPRGKWPLGRIEEVYEGPDGHVRVAKVRVGKKFVYSTYNKTLSSQTGLWILSIKRKTQAVFLGNCGALSTNQSWILL